MENTARFYDARCREAYALYNTERHGECVAMLEAMTYDANLPLWFHLQVHRLLADAVDEISIARDHLARAEAAYAEIIERWPEGTPGQEKLHDRLKLFRTDMDDIKREVDEDEASAGQTTMEGADDEAEQVEQTEQAEQLSQVSQQSASQDQELSQVSSVPPQQDDSQTTASSPLATRPHLTPVTPRARLSGKAMPVRGTPTSIPRYHPGGASPIKRSLEDDEDEVPESPSKKTK